MDVMIDKADRDDLDAIVVRRLEFLREVRGGEVEMTPEFIGATRRFITTEFDAGRLHTWMARDVDENATIGLVSLLLWARPPRPESPATCDGYVVNMFVEPRVQRMGIGRRLLDECMSSRAELSIGRFVLHATEAGRELYESMGFEPNPDWLMSPNP